VPTADEQFRVVIIGAGFSGLAMAIGLKQQGIQDFVVLERADDVGGVWQVNTYPGCRCDVPSHLYSLSFAPNPDWSQTFSPQPEIRDYLHRIADEQGIRPHIRTGVEVESAQWNGADACWEMETSAGAVRAAILISAMGPLTEPRLPEVPGLERFQGKTMHSARWDHDYELAGKRVASIGTGASAIQYVPEIAREVGQLYVFQRTPPWVMPHGVRPITDPERRLYRRVPAVQRLARGALYTGKELLVLGFAKEPRIMNLLGKLGRAHARIQISDPELRAQVRPHYAFGCKRILPSNRWYPALQRPNVELVPHGLAEVTEHTVLDTTGTEREVDAIIFGTGFHVTDIPAADRVRGRDGRLLDDLWKGSPRAYLGTSVPGFPNLFLMLGPNTGLGHSSMVYMIESQVRHVVQAIQELDRAEAATIEVRPEAYAAYNRELDAKMYGTVWDTGGCLSYYVDATGRNASIWPDWTWKFRAACTRFDPVAYDLTVQGRAPVAA
jgi:cation diffusion facilitator CzcD-associated flavoprotein CzcO